VSLLTDHLPVLGAGGGIVLLLALRTFLKLARIVVIAVLAVAVVAAVHAGIVP
jgi:hypothetical protein